MMTYNRKCPACGQMNRKLYLAETDGYMECERCGTVSYVLKIDFEEIPRRKRRYDRIRDLLDGVTGFAGAGEAT